MLPCIISDRATTRSLTAGDAFNHHCPFANLSRASPSLFAVDAMNRLVWKTGRTSVVGIMVGGMTSCNLVYPHSYTIRSGKTCKIKRITIAPMAESMTALQVFVKKVFNRNQLKTTLETAADITFSTRKEGTCKR